MNKYFLNFDEKITNKLYKKLLSEKYQLECRLWATEKDRGCGNVQKFPINDQSLTMAILNPHHLYKENGCVEIWATGPDSHLLYHKADNLEGLYIPTLEQFKITFRNTNEQFIVEK